MGLNQYVLIGAIFIAVVAFIWGANQLLLQRGTMRKRVQQLRGVAGGEQGDVDAEATTALHRIAEPVAKLAQPDTEEEITRFRAKFLNAGIRDRSAPLYFLAIKVVAALALPFLAWIYVQAFGSHLKGQAVLTVLVLAASIGYYVPNKILNSMVARRQRELFESFPDAIDLMIVCMEAGLSLDMSVQRAGQEIGLRSPALADELALVGTELRIGATRERAMRNLAARTGVEEISMFVAMLLQADRFGVSVGESMRIHAGELRLRRQYRAEEEATKIPTKLLFPLMLCIFPAILVVLVGPAGISLMQTMSAVK